MIDKKLNVMQASFLVVIVTITHLVLNLPNSLIRSTGSSAILNVLYITALSLIMFLFVKKCLSVFENKNILFVSEYIGGKFLKRLLTFLYIVHFIMITGILMRSFSEMLICIYFPRAATWTILLAFLLVAIISVKLGGNNVIRTNAILMVPILSAIIITELSLISRFEINRIFPIIGYGFNQTFISGSSNIYAFSGIVYIYFIKSDLKNSRDFSKVGFISIIISAIYLLLTVTSLLMMFPFLTSDNQTMSVYLSTRLIEYGNFMQRVDALYMFVWIFIFFSYLSVIFIYINQIKKESFYFVNTNLSSIIVAILIYIVAIVPRNIAQIRFLETTVYKYTSLGIVFILSFTILLLGYLKKKKELLRKENI